MPATMVFRCDGSAAIGAGHMMRCLALAETATRFGFRPLFLSAPGSAGVVRAVAESGYEVRETTGSGASTIAATIGHAEVAVIDGYGYTAGDEKALCDVATRVVAFEDRPNRQHAAAVIVDPTPGRHAGDYAGLVPPLATVLAGTDYAIMRPLWRKARLEGRRAGANWILVSMGATDPVNATAKVIEAIKASGVSAPVAVVLGQAAPHRLDVAGRLDDRMTLHIDPVDLVGLVQGAMLAIGASGTSSFERALLGLPSILVQTADNQSDIAQAFEHSGAAELVSISTLEDAAPFGALVAALYADDERRNKISAAAKVLCDGRGALRLLAVLAGEVVAKDGTRLTLRLAEVDDSNWLLELQRKPETRRFARAPVVPSAEDHRRWYARLMDDTERTLLIVESGGEAFGFVRLDRHAVEGDARFEVSIAVDPAQHGRGLGSAALQLARRFAPGATFDATVLPANLASRALFSNAGYDQIGPALYRSKPN